MAIVKSEWSSPISFTVRDVVAYLEETRIVANDGVVEDYFGDVVALSGDGSRVVISSVGSNSFSGAIYVFLNSGGFWTLEAKLIADDSEVGDEFSASLAMSSDGLTIIVGAAQSDGRTGSAYVFVRSGTTWTQQAKLTAEDALPLALFGYSVKLTGNGDVAAISARQDGEAASFSGAVYIFTRTNNVWSQFTKLMVTPAMSDTYIGHALDISDDGTTLAVSSISVDVYSGRVYIFIQNNGVWSQQATLVASDSTDGYDFGGSLSLSNNGDTLLIGSTGNNDSMGAAYVFTRTGATWTERVILEADVGTANALFGVSVAISGDGLIAVIGETQFDDPVIGEDVGAVYIFTQSEGVWTLKEKIMPAAPVEYSYFGYSVTISKTGNKVLVGASEELGGLGAVYVF